MGNFTFFRNELVVHCAWTLTDTEHLDMGHPVIVPPELLITGRILSEPSG